MPEKRIRLLGDEVLRQKCPVVADPCAPAVAQLAEDLRDTLLAFRREHGFGRGIAAPQIGALERVIVVDAPAQGFSATLVNPEIVRHGDQKLLVWDLCFSLPELVVQVERFVHIAVAYSGLDGSRHTVELSGDLSELLQHEIDHLDGILMLDRAVNPRAVWSRAEWERRHPGGWPGK